MVSIAYISDFLTKVEGPRQTRGYIPCFVSTGGTANYRGGPNPQNYSAMGVSGVTIATGCDLGQTDAATMAAYGLAQDVIGVFKPYFGAKKHAAISLLHQKPLVVTDAAAEATDHAVHGGYLSRYVIPAYDRTSGIPFANLPPQAQAVVMSVCFQKGCTGVARDWPKTWKYLTTQNWQAASRELQTGFTQYRTRRTLEGKLLEELL